MSPRSWRISVCSQEVCRASWKKHWHRLLPVSDAFGLLPAQKGKKYMQTVSCEAAVGVAGLLWGCHLLTISHAGESWRLSCPFLSPLTGAVAIISQHSSHYTASNANWIFFLLFTYLTWDFFFPLLQPGVLLYFPFVCPSVHATTTTFLIWIKIGGVVENLLNFVCTLSSVQSPQWV